MVTERLFFQASFQLAQTAGRGRGWYVFQIGHEISVLQAEIFGVIMRQFLPVRHAQQRVIPELAAGKIGRNHARFLHRTIFWSAAGEPWVQ